MIYPDEDHAHYFSTHYLDGGTLYVPIEKYYLYKKYSDIDDLAKTLMRVLKRQFKVKTL